MKKNKYAFRVFRGGSWYNGDSVDLRGAYRYGDDIVIRDDNLGFRLVLINESNENKNEKE